MLRAKDNPFAVDRIQRVRYEPQGDSWACLLRRLKARRYRGAIVGPCGSGKTTLCEDLQARLEQTGLTTGSLFISLDTKIPWRDIRRLLTESYDVLLVDGADHLSRWTWQRLKRRIFKLNRGLIVTTHRPGLLPTWHVCRTSPGLLQGITNRLLPDPQTIPRPQIEELFQLHQGNIRNALRHLYDLAGEQEDS